MKEITEKQVVGKLTAIKGMSKLKNVLEEKKPEIGVMHHLDELV